MPIPTQLNKNIEILKICQRYKDAILYVFMLQRILVIADFHYKVVIYKNGEALYESSPQKVVGDATELYDFQVRKFSESSDIVGQV